jgi:predicted alpha/beta-fold hydrolase
MGLYKILKKPFFGKFMVKWKNTLNQQQQLEWQKITFKSKSGGLIHGLFATSLFNKTKATIVLGHPMGKEAKGYFIKNGYTDLLRKNGYNVLVFDINGFGESSHGSFSYYEDIVAASIKAKELTPNLPIGYHGISLGGQWATIAFANQLHQYNFAIVESAATTLEDFWIMFPTAHRFLKLLYFFMPTFKKKINMVERIKEAKNLSSILFIYSLTDDWTPVLMGEKFKANCKIKSELWTVAESKHAMMMKSEYKQAYEQKILHYFEEAVKIPVAIV